MLAPGGRPAERNPRVHGLAEHPRLRRVANGAQARQEWERAVRDRPDLAVTQLPAWLDCMFGAGYHDATRLYESADGRRLVLPLARRGQLPGMGMSASWPMYWEGGLDNGGLLSADGPVTADDVADVAQDLRRNPGLRTTVTPSIGDAAAWAAGVPDDVQRTVDTMFSVDLERRLRRLVGERVQDRAVQGPQGRAARGPGGVRRHRAAAAGVRAAVRHLGGGLGAGVGDAARACPPG